MLVDTTAARARKTARKTAKSYPWLSVEDLPTKAVPGTIECDFNYSRLYREAEKLLHAGDVTLKSGLMAAESDKQHVRFVMWHVVCVLSFSAGWVSVHPLHIALLFAECQINGPARWRDNASCTSPPLLVHTMLHHARTGRLDSIALATPRPAQAGCLDAVWIGAGTVRGRVVSSKISELVKDVAREIVGFAGLKTVRGLVPPHVKHASKNIS